jgi:hypothetical protein
MHLEGPATGHLDTGFLGFPLSLNKCWDGSQVPSCYCMLLMQPSRFKLINRLAGHPFASTILVATVWIEVIVGANYWQNVNRSHCWITLLQLWHRTFDTIVWISCSLRHPADIIVGGVAWRTPLEFQCTPENTTFQSSLFYHTLIRKSKVPLSVSASNIY